MQKNKINTQLKTLPKAIQMIIGAVVAFGAAAVIKLFLSNMLGL